MYIYKTIHTHNNKPYCSSLVMVTNEGSIACKYFKQGIVVLISHMASHIKSLKFNLLYISKFRFYYICVKMLSNTHLKAI